MAGRIKKVSTYSVGALPVSEIYDPHSPVYGM